MIIKADNIKKEFFRTTNNTNVFTAVENTDIMLEEGQIIILHGRSGSGKSTLINMLSGILKPSNGRVLYDETDIYALDNNKLSAFRNANIGYIPQGKSAIASMTLKENITLPGILYNKDVDSLCQEYMEILNISKISDCLPSELSGGELKRMAIARALIMSPKVLFADEPTGDLDDENTKTVMELFDSLAKKGMIIFMVTHENDIDSFADTVYRMNAGILTKEI
ncbi:MAG: ATP-binding cassette domain-containing protein [Lachnospiraceae bacterium]|nr:ATP-binding cassette domain-containing protein [Lachnospiraceae bacterium]